MRIPMSIQFYTDKNASLAPLKGKTVAVIGYGSQGRAQALCMKDSGINVIVGVRRGKSFSLAKKDGMKVASVFDASKMAEIIHVLLPDEYHEVVYTKEIKPHLESGKTLSFSHGFSIVFKQIIPPKDVDVIMVSPRSPGPAVRRLYLEGKGVLCSIAIHQNHSKKAKETALALAKACGFTRIGAMECTFEQETIGDLFAEQAVLCGGVSEMIKRAYETLVESGHPPEMAYLDCLHELKLLVDLINERGIEGMYEVVSNTAEFGARRSGPKIMDDHVKKNMESILKEIKSGKFAKGWVRDFKNGLPEMEKKRKKQGAHSIEPIGKELRKKMGIGK